MIRWDFTNALGTLGQLRDKIICQTITINYRSKW